MTIAQNISSERVEATTGAGAIRGQVAIGQYVLQIGDVNGGIVNIALPDQQPGARPRPTPVDLRPRLFRGLLDRKTTIESASAALQAAQPVEVNGQEGIGKTSLLRYLAHQPLAGAFTDGIIYLSARRQGAGDLRLALFDAFYDRDMAYRPTETQIKYALREKKALILLDDVELARAELEQLMDAAPGCTFLLTAQSGHLWGEGHVLTLSGLPLKDGVALLARELGRPLARSEGPAAEAIWRGVSGHPLLLILAATAIREEKLAVADLALLVQSDSPESELAGRLLERRSAKDKRALAVLAALNGAPVDARQIASVAGLPDAKPVLESLNRDGLVQIQEGRYALSDLLSRVLDQIWELAPWQERLLDYFLENIGRKHPDIGQLLNDAEALMQATTWALDAGRLADAIRLVKSLEGALAQSGRWDAWSESLGKALAAARAQGDQSTMAWALHQIGTRAMCLAKKGAAREALIQALRLREALGDRAGAAVTRHNLRILLGPPPPPRKPPGDSVPPSNGTTASGSSFLLKAATALLFVTTIALAGLLISAPAGRNQDEPQVELVFEATATAEPAATAMATPWPTFTVTATPTDIQADTPTATATATATNTATATSTATPTSTPCGPPGGWAIYVVRRGDTLFALSRATGASIWQLKSANCLVGDRIDAGQNLFVPRLPQPVPIITAVEKTRVIEVEPTPTNTPTRPIERTRVIEKVTPTDTPTPTPTSTPTATPTPTNTPTPTPTNTPTPTTIRCPEFSFTKFSVTRSGEGVDISWQTTGGCAPLTGKLVIQYDDGEFYESYEFTKPYGDWYDQLPIRCGGTFKRVYELSYFDAMRQTADASGFIEVSWECPAKGQ